jgi:centrosomal protein CEP120
MRYQYKMISQQLKDKELTYMKALAEEWRRRHKDREVLMQKKVNKPLSLVPTL